MKFGSSYSQKQIVQRFILPICGLSHVKVYFLPFSVPSVPSLSQKAMLCFACTPCFHLSYLLSYCFFLAFGCGVSYTSLQVISWVNYGWHGCYLVVSMGQNELSVLLICHLLS